MLISASFLTSKNIPHDLTLLNKTDTDFIHVDVMDGKMTKAKSLPFKEMRHIYKYTSKRLDVHLMVEKPEKFIKDYARLNAEYITFNIEVDTDIEAALSLIKSYGIKCGLALAPDTKVKEVVPYLPLLDQILILGVYPGKGGQEFIKETKEKIKELKVLLKEYKSKAKISVDGGVNDKTKKQIGKVDILVAGNYILSSEDYQEAITILRK